MTRHSAFSPADKFPKKGRPNYIIFPLYPKLALPCYGLSGATSPTWPCSAVLSRTTHSFTLCPIHRDLPQTHLGVWCHPATKKAGFHGEWLVLQLAVQVHGMMPRHLAMSLVKTMLKRKQDMIMEAHHHDKGTN